MEKKSYEKDSTYNKSYFTNRGNTYNKNRNQSQTKPLEIENASLQKEVDNKSIIFSQSKKS